MRNDSSGSGSRDSHKLADDRREDGWRERRGSSRERRAEDATVRDARRRRYSLSDSDEGKERSRRHRHSRRRRHDSSDSDSDSEPSRSSGGSRYKRRREDRDSLREKSNDRRPHRHDSEEEEEEERRRRRKRRHEKRDRHGSHHSHHRRSHRTRSRSPSRSPSPSTSPSPHRHHHSHRYHSPPPPPPTDVQHTARTVSAPDDPPRVAAVHCVDPITTNEPLATTGDALTSQPEAPVDAPPPLEAPPVERSDSLPPLEAVDESTQETTTADSSTALNRTEPQIAPSTHSLTSLSDTTVTADTTTATAAPAADLRALINKLAPIPIHNAAATTAATATATVAAASQTPLMMTLDDWRRLSQSRPELSMKVLGEPADRKKKERGLTGMGGGWKGTDGWKCESLHCVQYENRKYDTVCGRCNAVRRFQRA